MIKGVSADEEKIIVDILSSYFKKYAFYYYGSRVRGDFSPLSDLDILTNGKNPITPDDLEDLKNKFDNSDLPYIVNITDFHAIEGKFYNSIKEDLVKIIS